MTTIKRRIDYSKKALGYLLIIKDDIGFRIATEKEIKQEIDKKENRKRNSKKY